MTALRWIFPIFATFVLAASTADTFAYGQPECPGRVLDKHYFVICYSSGSKIPVWVGYVLTREDLSQKIAERKNNFRPDRDLLRGERAELSDYAGSGFDRGHLAPAADFTRSKDAMSTSFLLSNMAPQVGGFNRGRWANLEEAIRDLVRAHGKVWVFTGSAFAGGRPLRSIGANQVAVPSHFYKAVLCVHGDDTKEMFGFILPNTGQIGEKLAHFAHAVDFIETFAQLDFFGNLPRNEQRRLERGTNPLPPR
ncbi:MAG: DNA/RNA non-specific endonuclease [Bryobacteraceae bacterium]